MMAKVKLLMDNDKAKLVKEYCWATKNAIESYFKLKEPDCSLFSEEGYEILIHKELLFQTKFMQQIVKNIDCFCCKIEIFFPSILKEDLEKMIMFLYTGELTCNDRIEVCKLFVNLTKLLGFTNCMQINGKAVIPNFVKEVSIKRSDQVPMKNVSSKKFSSPSVDTMKNPDVKIKKSDQILMKNDRFSNPSENPEIIIKKSEQILMKGMANQKFSNPLSGAKKSPSNDIEMENVAETDFVKHEFDNDTRGKNFYLCPQL